MLLSVSEQMKGYIAVRLLKNYIEELILSRQVSHLLRNALKFVLTAALTALFKPYSKQCQKTSEVSPRFWRRAIRICWRGTARGWEMKAGAAGQTPHWSDYLTQCETQITYRPSSWLTVRVHMMHHPLGCSRKGYKVMARRHKDLS